MNRKKKTKKKPENKEQEFIGLKAATRLLTIALHIPFLEDEKPVGILLIAQPGMGKSMLLTRFESPNILRFNDLTGWGFERTLTEMQELQRGYIVIPDLLRLMARKKGWEAFLTLTNIVLEEGIEALRRFDTNVRLDRPLNFGVITAMTTDVYRMHRDRFQKTGFASRFGKFAYSYERSDARRIENLVASKSTYQAPKIEIQDKVKAKVEIEKALIKPIMKIGKIMGNGKPPHFRAIDFVRRLAKARALSEGRDAVIKEDLIEIYALIPFFVPPYPTATDLEYYLLLGKNDDELLERYTEEEIENAKYNLRSKKGLVIPTKSTVKETV